MVPRGTIGGVMFEWDWKKKMAKNEESYFMDWDKLLNWMRPKKGVGKSFGENTEHRFETASEQSHEDARFDSGCPEEFYNRPRVLPLWTVVEYQFGGGTHVGVVLGARVDGVRVVYRIKILTQDKSDRFVEGVNVCQRREL